MSGIRLIVGLGNPGAEYENTRHNVGFWFVDKIASEQKASWSEQKKFQALVTKITLKGRDVWLLKPQTFMNLSGQAVQAIQQYYKITPEETLVVHDELDLLPGTMKYKLGGGNAGHNGLKSIQTQCSTPNFHRLRIGIGHPRTFGWTQDVATFVLAAPSTEHKELIFSIIQQAQKLLPAFIQGDYVRISRLIPKYVSALQSGEDTTI